LLIACLLLVSGGCATLPKSLPVQNGEADQVRQEFQTMLRDQRQCPPALDADVSVTVDNLLWTGTLTGYLRAMAPAYLRFEGVNPLGLTEAILAIDGKNFTYLSVRDQQAYSGPLTAKLLSRYAPDGLAASMSYYWLLGRIPPGSLRIGEVGLDEMSKEYWLDLYFTATGRWSRVLFNPAEHLVKRHLLLSDRDAIDADLLYEYPRQQAATSVPPRPEQKSAPLPSSVCPPPDRIIIKSLGSGQITLGVNKRYPAPRLDSTPFRITPPADYKRIVVQ
jgi:hypothetical protein